MFKPATTTHIHSSSAFIPAQPERKQGGREHDRNPRPRPATKPLTVHGRRKFRCSSSSLKAPARSLTSSILGRTPPSSQTHLWPIVQTCVHLSMRSVSGRTAPRGCCYVDRRISSVGTSTHFKWTIACLRWTSTQLRMEISFRQGRSTNDLHSPGVENCVLPNERPAE